MIFKYDVTPQYGEIKLGPFRLHWVNPEERGEPGFTVLSFKETNLELGQVDQDQPGIYLTRYESGEVLPIRTLITF